MNDKTVKDKLIDEKLCYSLLKKVFQDEAYGGIELNKLLSDLPNNANAPYITRLFYGVIEKSVEFDFVVRKFTEKTPKPSVIIILKMGLYLINYMSTPSYAAVDKMVELSKDSGKSGVSGFVNSFLRKAENYNGEDLNGDELFSFKTGYPLWLLGMLKKDYGEVFISELLSFCLSDKIHIRPNLYKLNYEELGAKSKELNPDKCKIGYYVTHDTIKTLNSNDYIVQSLASMIATKAYSEHVTEEFAVLDVCAAPGGKSVYLKQLTNAKVTACDIHEHRVELIKKYAEKYATHVVAEVADGTEKNENFIEKFDVVICDVPCSGIGVVSSKPDILLRRKPEDIANLCSLQKKILSNCSQYVKKGGYLYYSTCTILKRENEGVVKDFLTNNNDFKLSKISISEVCENGGMVSLFPHINETDGFFICKMVRV